MSTGVDAPTLASVLDAAEEAASQLGDTATVETLRAVRDHLGTATLSVLIAGSTGSGRSSMVNALAGTEVLPQSPIPKAPIAVTVGYGPHASLHAVRPDGIRTTLPRDRLRHFLLNPGTVDEYVALHVQVPAEALAPINLRIEPLEALYTPAQWETALSAADYLLMVLDATALLSEAERRFLRDRLAPHAGTRGIGVIVTKMDLIPEEERESILDLVRTFLGSFGSYSTIVPISAVEPTGRDALWTLLDDLLERQAPLRIDALHGTLERAVDALAEDAARQEAIHDLNDQDVEQLREAIASKRAWLQSRIARAQRRIDAFITTILKEAVLREVQAFGDVFRERLPDEIASIEDVREIRRHLPGYMETVWFEFLHWQTIIARSRLMEELRAIEETVESDLREMVESAALGLGERFAEFRPASHTMHVFVMPRRGKHQASTVAKQLSWLGLGLLTFTPLLGILSLSASQVVQRVFKRDVAAAERQAIVPAAVAASRDLQHDLETRIVRQFATLSEEMGTQIAEAYGRGVERLEEALSEADTGEQGAATRARLHELAATTIPRLRAQLAELREVAPA